MKFKYEILRDPGTRDEREDLLNRRGFMGWRLVSVWQQNGDLIMEQLVEDKVVVVAQSALAPPKPVVVETKPPEQPQPPQPLPQKKKPPVQSWTK